MRIRQLSVFLENQPGQLCRMTDHLAQNGINISAISLADTTGFGIVRMIVDDPDRAKAVLSEAGVVCKTTDVSALAMNDTPGGLSDLLHVLSEEKINVEYMYAFVSVRSGKALMVVQTDDLDRTEEVLNRSGSQNVSPSDIYRI